MNKPRFMIDVGSSEYYPFVLYRVVRYTFFKKPVWMELSRHKTLEEARAAIPSFISLPEYH